MINGETMVVLIVLIAVIGSVLKKGAKHGHRGLAETSDRADPAEAARLRQDVQQLRERIQVLERVITDNRRSTDLDSEIERLRDR